MKKTTTFVRILSALMATIMVAVAIPVQAIALPADETEQIEAVTEADVTNDSNKKNIFIVGEDVSKRGQFEKHYVCSDGTYVVTTYAEAIHYMDDNGEWIDVDNRPQMTATGEYAVHNGDFSISVPSSADEGHLIRMDKGEHSLSWTLSANKEIHAISTENMASTMMRETVQSQKIQVGINKRPQIIVSNEENVQELDGVLREEANFELPNVSGKVRYNNLFGSNAGISVVYTTYQNKIEEDIYIQKPTDITSFSMEVDAPDLTARLNADNSVDFLDSDGKMCYHVDTPYMMDADFAVLNDIETTVTRSGETWVITYTPDAAWLSSEERVYPILLDPSITTDEFHTAIYDTYVEQNSTVNHSSEQFLYVSGTAGAGRKAVVRINKMPVIDDTMPLISAKMDFAVQYTPFSDVALTLDYITGNSSISMSAYTYADASETAIYSTSYILTPGFTSVSFDLTKCIHEILSGTGDFVLRYTTDGDTTACFPFYSTESTTGAGPVLTVTYGYSLPDGVANGAVVALQNCGSGLFASVDTNPTEYANVYQVERSNGKPTDFDLFTLRYNEDTGAYRLYYRESSSPLLLTIPTTTNELVFGNKNVRLEDLDDYPERSQDWVITTDDGMSFRILPRTNMRVCLTANGNTEGTSSGTGTGTAGNVCVKTVDSNSAYQRWWFVRKSGNIYSSEYAPVTLENGLYYFINSYSGRYLYKDGVTASSTRGFITDTHASNNVSNTSVSIYQVYRKFITWRITNLGDGYCTIQNPEDMNYLYAQVDTAGNIHSSRQVKIGSMGEDIPDQFKWRGYTVAGGGMIFKSKLGEYYLTLSETSLQDRNANIRLYGKYSALSTSYGQQVWRVFKQEDYVEPSGYFSLSIPALDIDEPQYPAVTSTISNCSLKQPFDFYYTASNTNVSIDNRAGTITGLKSGTATVRPVHKTTGFAYGSFTVKINKNAIIIVPGLLGSELFVGANNPYFEYGTPIFTDEMLTCINSDAGSIFLTFNFSMYINWAKNAYSDAEYILHIIDSLSCGANGNSNYEVFVKEYDPNCSSTSYLYTNKCGTDDTYKDLYDYLSDAYPNYEIRFFSYDWRNSCKDSAEKLHEFIDYYEYTKVHFVSHSMGGIVLSSYLKKIKTENISIKIGECVYLESPLYGSLETVQIIANEFTEIFPIIVDSETLKNMPALERGPYKLMMLVLHCAVDIGVDAFCLNIPSVYDLLPSSEFFSESPGVVMKYNETVLTYSQATEKWCSKIPGFKQTLLNASSSNDNSLVINGRFVSNYFSSYYFYTSSNQKTISCVNMEWALLGGMSSSADTGYVGDSLVPYWSAYPINSPADRRIVLNASGAEELTDHMNIIDKFISYDETNPVFN